MATRLPPAEVPESKPVVQLDAAVFGATVQLPSFDRVEPDAWFCVADANFALRKVTDSTTRYYYVLSKLDSATLRKLSSFFKMPRGSDPYQEIRSMLCETFEPAMEQKLDTLLAINDAGDERPKEFGLELKRLLANATAEDILKRIFIRSLKPSVVTAVTGSLSGSFDALMAAANKAWTASATETATPASVSAVSAPPPASARRTTRGGCQRGPPRSPGQIKSVALCTYHIKFGNAAKRCVPSCSRWGDQNRQQDAATAKVFQVEEALDGEDTAIGSEN